MFGSSGARPSIFDNLSIISCVSASLIWTIPVRVGGGLFISLDILIWLNSGFFMKGS